MVTMLISFVICPRWTVGVLALAQLHGTHAPKIMAAKQALEDVPQADLGRSAGWQRADIKSVRGGQRVQLQLSNKTVWRILFANHCTAREFSLRRRQMSLI